MGIRKPSKHLIATYVTRTSSGKHVARIVDSRTKRENKCTKTSMMEAISCSRDKVTT